MNTRLISESGILTGLSVTILLIAAISPVNNLFIASASALVLEVSIKRNTMKQSLFVYLATAVLGFFILPYKPRGLTTNTLMLMPDAPCYSWE